MSQRRAKMSGKVPITMPDGSTVMLPVKWANLAAHLGNAIHELEDDERQAFDVILRRAESLHLETKRADERPRIVPA